MKKLNKIFFLSIFFIILTTFNPNNYKSFQIVENQGLFNIQKIEVTDNYLVSENEIKLKLQNLYKKNIFSIKVVDFEKPLSKIDFLNKIKIRKKYPDTIELTVYEEKPIAILNRKNKKFIVCESSKLIPFEKNRHFNSLPNVFGEESEIFLANFLKDLTKIGFPIERIKNFYFFKIGRWDIQLSNEQLIKLPFTNIAKSIGQSIQLLNRKDFQKYKVIDLRISGKIITD